MDVPPPQNTAFHNVIHHHMCSCLESIRNMIQNPLENLSVWVTLQGWYCDKLGFLLQRGTPPPNDAIASLYVHYDVCIIYIYIYTHIYIYIYIYAHIYIYIYIYIHTYTHSLIPHYILLSKIESNLYPIISHCIPLRMSILLEYKHIHLGYVVVKQGHQSSTPRGPTSPASCVRNTVLWTSPSGSSQGVVCWTGVSDVSCSTPSVMMYLRNHRKEKVWFTEDSF